MLQSTKAQKQARETQKEAEADYENEPPPRAPDCAEDPQKRSDPRANHFGIAVRAQVLTLREYTNMTINQVAAITGVGSREVSNIMKRARDRGYRKDSPIPLQDKFFQDAPRSGRPATAVTEENAENVKV